MSNKRNLNVEDLVSDLLESECQYCTQTKFLPDCAKSRQGNRLSVDVKQLIEVTNNDKRLCKLINNLSYGTVSKKSMDNYSNKDRY